MYSTIIEVREGIKTEALSNIIGNDYIDDEAEREEQLELIIISAIADADGEIDGYLSRRYSVPLANAPQVIKKFSKDITLYNIFSRMGIDEDTRENTYYLRYKAAIKFLENVAKGVIDVPSESGDEGQSSPKADYRVQSSQRIFSRNSLRRL